MDPASYATDAAASNAATTTTTTTTTATALGNDAASTETVNSSIKFVLVRRQSRCEIVAVYTVEK